MPTAAQLTFTNTGIVPFYPGFTPKRHGVKLPNSVTYARGTVLGEITATPGVFKAYASGAVDGSQIPKAILEHDCATDASGNVTLGPTAGGSEWGQTQPYASAFFAGDFATGELVGLDAAALTNRPSWGLINGTVTNGVLRLA
jgi:hypothetical protein